MCSAAPKAARCRDDRGRSEAIGGFEGGVKGKELVHTTKGRQGLRRQERVQQIYAQI